MWAAVKAELNPAKVIALKAMEGAALTVLVVREKVAEGAGVGTTGHPAAARLLDASSSEVAV